MRTENFEFIHVLDIGDMGYWVDGVLPKILIYTEPFLGVESLRIHAVTLN